MPLDTQNGIFDSKLRELEAQYRQMVERLRLYEQQDHAEICRELENIRQECGKSRLQMQEDVAGSRSPAVAALAAAQLEYARKVDHILRNELPEYLHADGCTRAEDQAEAASLYGEYAIDFAGQAMRYALLAALSAMDLQMRCEEQRSACSDQAEGDAL